MARFPADNSHPPPLRPQFALNPNFETFYRSNRVVPINVAYGSIKVESNQQVHDSFFFLSPVLCEGGELFNYMLHPVLRNFLEPHARRIFRQLIEG